MGYSEFFLVPRSKPNHTSLYLKSELNDLTTFSGYLFLSE